MEQVIGGPRARYREQVRDEVRAHAWDQIVEAGASALSLKAIAKKMGMTAPALYRYFASRDELLTELVLTAYSDLAGIVEAVPVDADPGTTLRLLAGALRDWAST
ncbi:MAG: TetR/AcrR family transcriptional regulator, partial [Umezawaea sp.]